MAKMQEEVIVIKVSKLLKDSQESSTIIDAETMLSLETVVQELAGATVLVEIEKA